MLNLVTALSLLLCAAACVLWVRSYSEPHETGVGPYTVTSTNGRVYVESLSDNLHRLMLGGWGGAFTPPPPPAPFLVTGVHYALPTAATAILPVAWFVQLRRRNGGHVPGLCARCGYDLRASPGRCPECGTVSPSRGGA